MRAWLCARAANESQNEWEVKVDAQLERLRRYASEQGWEIVGETRESATSSNARRRPGLAFLLEIAVSHPKQFDILLVESLCRLSRDGLMQECILRRLELAGIEVRTTEGLTSSSKATLARRMCLSVDEYIDRIAEDVRFSRLAAARAGHWPERAPFGYVRVVDCGRRTLAIHEDEAQVVRYAFHLASNYGEGATGIARHLNDAGYTTRSGKAWSVSAIGRMLGDAIYSGVARIKAPLDIDNIAESITGIRISVPRIISRRLFMSVQRICRDRFPRRSHTSSPKSRVRKGRR